MTSAVAGEPGARLVFKKIDSTLRGNIAAETEAVLRAADATLAVCAPAFPGTGRTTVDGVQYAHGERVGDVPALFAGCLVTSISLAAVRRGDWRTDWARPRTMGRRWSSSTPRPTSTWSSSLGRRPRCRHDSSGSDRVASQTPWRGRWCRIRCQYGLRRSPDPCSSSLAPERRSHPAAPRTETRHGRATSGAGSEGH